MDLLQKINLEEIKEATYKVRLIESLDYGKAALTHYLHNYSDSNVSKYFKKSALAYLKHALEFKYPDIDINNEITEKVMRHLLLTHKDDINFPGPNPSNTEFTFIDLFAGIGGFRLAAQSLGGKCVFTSEWDEYAQKTYESNFGEIPFGDITKSETKKFIPKKFDLLCAGFPCQPLSYAGLNRGFEDATRGTLFFDILEIIKECKPKMFLLENVKGLKSHEGGKTLLIIEKSLKDLGYTIKWEVLNSYDFGLPQYRERWYCVGFKKKVEFTFPKGNKRGVKIKSIIDKKANKDKKLMLSKFEMDRIDFHFKSNDERVQHDNSKYERNTKKGRHGVFFISKTRWFFAVSYWGCC